MSLVKGHVNYMPKHPVCLLKADLESVKGFCNISVSHISSMRPQYLSPNRLTLNKIKSDHNMLQLKVLLLLSLLISGCAKIRSCNYCEKGTLYYVPECATIEGYVIFEDSTVKVFNHDIPKEFQKQGIEVCISYKSKGNKTLTADCAMGEMIKITCFK